MAKVAKVAMVTATAETVKAELAGRFEDLAHRCLDGTTPGKIEGAKLLELTWSAAVSVDKMRLLREQPPPPGQAEVAAAQTRGPGNGADGCCGRP